MVSALAHYAVFSSPLRAQAFALFRFALGAISLPTVKTVKLMPVFARFLGLIDCRDRATILKRVLGGCYQSKMFRIDTSAISTFMIYIHSFLDVAMGKVIRDSMRASIPPSEKENPVAVLILVPCKDMTTIIMSNIIIKAFYFFMCVINHAVQYTPCKENCKYV